MVTRRPIVLNAAGIGAELPGGDTLPPAVVALANVSRTYAQGAYTAADGEYVMADASGGAITITLPPSGVAGVKKVDNSANLVTVAASSGKTLGTQAAASVPLRLPDQAMITQVSGTSHVITDGYNSLASLDNRYRRAVCFDDFTSKADGTLNATLSDSGHTWITASDGQSGSSAPVIYGGAIGTPAGHVAGGGNANSISAGYAYLQPGGTVGWVGAVIRWDASDAASTSLCLGAFTQTGITTTTGGANMHLVISPWGFQFGVFTAGSNELTASGYLTPDGGDTNFPRLSNPMVCDGATTYRVDVVIDQARGRAYVTIGDNPTVAFTDPRVRSVAATYAFWEYFAVTGGSNLPRFVSVWADPVSAADRDPQLGMRAAGAAGSGMSGRGGSGLPATRPSSRLRNGSTWFEPGAASTLSAATAAGATTFTAPVAYPVGSIVVVDTGYVREVRSVTALSGTGPFTIGVAALLYAHASGAAVAGAARTVLSDGQSWREPNGFVLGNRLPDNTATAAENANAVLLFSGSVSIGRCRAPHSSWRAPSGYRLTATAAGTFVVYATAAVVESGSPFFAGIGNLLAGTTARSCTLTLRMYNTSGTEVGTAVTTTTTVGTSTPTSLLTPNMIAPSGTSAQAAVLALAMLTVTTPANGEVFYAGDWCVAPGPVPAHLRA